MDVGPCSAQDQAWFFNHLTETCEEFVYSGCGGNKNRFTSKALCERRCNGPGNHGDDHAVNLMHAM